MLDCLTDIFSSTYLRLETAREAVELEDITTVNSSWCCLEQTPWELELLKARQIGSRAVGPSWHEEPLILIIAGGVQ